MIVGGSFEEPVVNTWTISSQGVAPPGWTVTSGDVDWGSYHTDGHCLDFNCAYAGEQFLDTCGTTSGRIEQTVSTPSSDTYLLSYAIAAHQGCGADTKTMNVYVDGQLFASEQFTRSGSWAHSRTSVPCYM
eukprot:COSAG05_NODE_464_length_9544_cov_2.541345_9_plen_131_part_00